MKIEKAAFKFVGGIANSKITVLAEAGLKLTASKTLLAMLCNAHFTHELRALIRSHVQSIALLHMAMGKWFMTIMTTSQKVNALPRLTDQPTD